MRAHHFDVTNQLPLLHAPHATLFVLGALIGAAGNSGGGDGDRTSAEPAATRTVTASPEAAKVEKAEPAPTITVTVTKTAEAKATKAATSGDDAPAGKALFKVWGSAPSGVDITYGSDGTNLQGKGLPMTKTLAVDGDALYYQVTAQLQGGGDVHCSITIDGRTKSGRAQGGYNICSAQLNSDFSGGFS
ncbi:hypothetical protein [Streptomyces sp. MBT53]|uniref:hypothetical protein n=1 Tax=Streptomyces sp. MBT53 TaxID=1488384 RepID=UPI0027DA3533|nr:hypothetical protein [Streptomyces sp. MBT53]